MATLLNKVGCDLFRSDVAKDTLSVLTPSQRDSLSVLLKDQNQPFQATQATRFEIIRALEGLLIGESLSREAFLDLGRAYGASEAELGRVIAQTLGDVAQSLTAEQKKSLADIREAHISGQGYNIERQGLKLKHTQAEKKERVNLAARFLSWTTGSEEFNDFKVVGKPSQHFGFVSLRIDSNYGVRRGDVAKEVLNLLTEEQQKILATAAAHDAREFNEFLKLQGNLMRNLEVALAGETIDAEKVQQPGAAVGEVEAKMTWSQAMATIGVRNSMTETQSADLLAMRAKYTANTNTLPEDPVDRGRQLFAQCVLCHDSTNQQSIAPDLKGIVGRKIADDPEYKRYSQAMQGYAEVSGVWSEGLLGQFLKSPGTLVPGTTMGFDGLDSSADIEAMVAYLTTHN